MQKFSALLFFLFIGTIMSLSSKSTLSPIEMNLLPQNSIMKRLNDVFLEIKAAPVNVTVKTFDAFVMVIMKLLSDLQQQNVEHAKILGVMQVKCGEESSFRSKEISDSNLSIKNAEASQNVCQAKLNKARTLRKTTKSLLADEQSKKKERTQIREKERLHFVSEKRQYDESIAFLASFITVVNKRFKEGGILSTSFVEFSEQLLRHVSGLSRLELALPVLIEMTQLSNPPAASVYSSAPDSKGAASLVEKLRNLLLTLQNDLQVIVNIETERVRDFNAFIVKVNQNIATLIVSLAKLKQQVAVTKACVEREKLIVQTALKKRERNASLAKKAENMCREFAQEAESAMRARENEIKVVKQIIDLLRVRFGALPANLTKYLASIEAEFKEYKNKTKLIAYTIYQKAHIDENVLGKDIAANANVYKTNKKF